MNDEWLSPLDIFYGSRPRLPLLPFLQPAYHLSPCTAIAEDRSPDPDVYFLNFGYNRRRDSYRPLDAETGMVADSRDVTWHHPEAPWITPIRAAPAERPRDIYAPMPKSVPVAAPCPAPLAAPPAPPPAATATAYTYVELPDSDPPARLPRIRTRGIRRDAREDAWRAPFSAQLSAGVRPSPSPLYSTY